MENVTSERDEMVQLAETTNWLQTVGGRKMDLIQPMIYESSWSDIAHHLACNNRYAGAMPVPFSVAQHSLMVEEILRLNGHDERTQLLGLLHDCEEAYIGDIISPVPKALAVMIPNFTSIWSMFKNNLRDAILHKAGFDMSETDSLWDVIHNADMTALAWEMRDLAANPPIENWTEWCPEPPVHKASFMTWDQARDAFAMRLVHHGLDVDMWWRKEDRKQ